MKKAVSHEKNREKAVAADGPAAFRTEFADRLRVILDEFESRQAASEIAGVNPDQLFKYLNRTSKPSFETMVRLADARGFSLDWLATGGGPRKSRDGFGSGYAVIPVWNVEASSGQGTFVGHHEPGDVFPLPLVLLRTSAVSVSNLCAVFNRGHSNAPDINDGDVMVVERGLERLVDDAYYIFDDDGLLLVKRIERLVGGGAVLKARNPDYETRSLSKDQAAQLHIFGRVRWRAGPI